jgi:hypothetical protein
MHAACLKLSDIKVEISKHFRNVARAVFIEVKPACMHMLDIISDDYEERLNSIGLSTKLFHKNLEMETCSFLDLKYCDIFSMLSLKLLTVLAPAALE